MLLESKVALVTGTGPNIGGEIARTLAANGARLACLDVRAEMVETTARQIQEEGGEALALAADITSPAAVERAVQATVDTGTDLAVDGGMLARMR
jgi:3-oxoacyl-[acyl-carrier protein] reductase